MRLPFVILAMLGLAAGPDEPLAPWGTNLTRRTCRSATSRRSPPAGTPTRSGKAARWTAPTAARRSAWG